MANQLNSMRWMPAALGALILFSCTMPPAKSRSARQQARRLETKSSHRVFADYLLYLPEGYESNRDKKWPLILFLHGMGERGTNLTRVKVHGPPKILEAGTNLPFVVVSPQCPLGQWWDIEMLDQLLDRVIRDERVDTNRIYLTGLSMGGFGSWAMALRYPERFAAVAPICGGGNPLYPAGYTRQQSAALKQVGFWAFHGGKDPVVPLEESQRMVDALKKAGCEVKFTIFPDAGHDSWTEAYSNPKLYDWLLEHKRR